MDILSGIKYYQPMEIGNNDNILQTLDKFIERTNANNLYAQQQYTNLMKTINELDLADEDKGLKTQIYDELANAINQTDIGLGMATSINTLYDKSRSIFKNPILQTALTNKINYDAYKQSILARQDVSEDMKQWWLSKENNQYKGITKNDIMYVPDEDGTPTDKISYVKTWQQNNTLAQHISNEEILDQAKKILNSDTTNKTTQQYEVVKDDNGNPQLISTGSEVEKTTELNDKKVWNAIYQVIMSDEVNYNSYHQQYNYEQDNPEKFPEAQGLKFEQWLKTKFKINGKTIPFVFKNTEENNLVKVQQARKGSTGSGSGSSNDNTTNLKGVGSGPIVIEEPSNNNSDDNDVLTTPIVVPNDTTENGLFDL